MKYLFSLLLILSCLTVFAQKNGSISVHVTDSTTHAPLDYVTVSIFKQGSKTPINGGTTDAQGNYTVKNLPLGEYALSVDFMSYQPLQKDHIMLTTAQPTVTFANLSLRASSKLLKEVAVVGKVATVSAKLDKTVYNPAGDLAAQGGTATDVLKKVPMVSVDVDGNLTLLGSPNVSYLINGKPSSIFGNSVADALQSIPASRIKNIELITNPGAKYDMVGSGGIINIVLKDNKIEGFNGSVNLAGSNRLASSTINLNYKKNNFGLNAFFGNNEQYNNQTPFIRNNTSTINSASSFYNNQTGTNDLTRGSYQTGLNAEYAVSKTDVFSASFGVHHFRNENGYSQNQMQELLDANQQASSQQFSQRYSNTRITQQTYDWSLNYKKTFKNDKQELNVLYTGSYGKNNGIVNQTVTYLNPSGTNTGIHSINPGSDHDAEFSVDYAQPVGKEVLIETGVKYISESLGNSNAVDTLLADGSYVPNNGQSYTFNYNQKIYGVYGSFSYSPGKSWDLKGGLRYENTKNSSDFPNTTIPSYGTLAPSFVAAYNIDDSQSLKLSYSFRIERPDYGELNPFYNISDPHNITTGNPSLKVETGRNVQLNYNKDFKSGANFSATALFRYNTQDIQNFTTFYPELTIGDVLYTNVSLQTRINMGSEQAIGVNLFGTVPIGALTLRSNVFAVNRTTKADFGQGPVQTSGLLIKANMNANYQFNSKLTAEAFANYNSAQIGIQGRTTAYFTYSMALKKQIGKDVSIGLISNNPFNNYVTQTSTTNLPGGRVYFYRQIPFRTIGLTLSYKFGKLGFGKKSEVEELPSTMDNTP